jgi:hypothetical protein
MRLARLLYFLPRSGQAKSRYRSLIVQAVIPTVSLDELKAAKPVIDIKPILDFKFSPVPLWNFYGADLSRKITGLYAESAIELWQHPKEPI